MNKADVIALIGDLAMDQQSADTVDLFFEATMKRLASLDKPPFVEAKLVRAPGEPPDGSQAVYDFEDDMIRLLTMFYTDKQLPFTQLEDLDAYSTTWRADEGTPDVYTIEGEAAQKFRVYPSVNVVADDLIPTHGEPFGEDFPDGWFSVFYSQYREEDIDDFYGLAIALDVLSQEFDYPSQHRDPIFAKVCQALANLLYKTVE